MTLIDPKDVIRDKPIDALCETADHYFRVITDRTHLLSKPFSSLMEGPQMIYKLGLLLEGLQLSKGMRVLDFASGSCWLSRILNQFGCSTISVDASARALEIGRELFALQPIIGVSIDAPAFIHFDGKKLRIPDESVDRVICFDGFHHVPNQKQVLAELSRVLKQGGVAGFSEPGRHHSRSPQSQYEMRNYDVLENDIIIEDILQLAIESGFTGAYLKPLIDPNLSLTPGEYCRILETGMLPDCIRVSSTNAMSGATVFFLSKGELRRDSRSYVGLQHKITLSGTEFHVPHSFHFALEVEVVNAGSARWLADAPNDIGTVKIGFHLYTGSGQLITLDFHRWKIARDVNPGESILARIDVPTPNESGEYLLAVDLVSEGVCWFQNVGSELVMVSLAVE
jgi:SAM-dependent methyltransferase